MSKPDPNQEPSADRLSHLSESGEPQMVDVSGKKETVRTAVASGKVVFPQDIFEELASADFTGDKGSIVQTAVIAGIQAVKKTSDLIPLCHPLALSNIDITIKPEPGTPELRIGCTVTCTGPTGVEMEVLTGVSVAALTIYDMCKALSHDIRITDLQLEHKSGGKHQFSR